MPVFEESGHGDLYIEYNVVLPNSLSPQMRKRKSAFRRELFSWLTSLLQSWLRFSLVRRWRRQGKMSFERLSRAHNLFASMISLCTVFCLSAGMSLNKRKQKS